MNEATPTMFSAEGVSTLLFDWDGTVVASAMSSFLTFQKALEHVGIPFTWEQFEAHFTPDWHRMYEAVGVPPERFKEADAAWKRSYPCVNYRPVQTPPTRSPRCTVADTGLG